MEKIITYITPTYNRAKLLARCYSGFKSQTNKNFVWLVVDDGSTDNTKEIIDNYIKESDFEIKYYYKENGGKHTALNFGIDKIDTILTMIVDSDDYLIPNATQTIIDDYGKYIKEDVVSISYLKGYEDGSCIGTEFSKVVEISNHIDKRINGNIKEDKAELFLTNVLRDNKFPVFDGEKFMSECIVWNRIAKRYKTAYINKIIYICEYQLEGLSKNWRKINLKAPKGAALVANEMTTKEFSLMIRIKSGIKYIMFSKIAGEKLISIFKSSLNKYNTICLILPGLILYKYNKIKGV